MSPASSPCARDTPSRRPRHWVQAGGIGGQLAVVIRADSAGLPGASIFSQTYTVPNQPTSTWVVFTFTNQPVLAANTPYWLSFEPVVGSALSYALDGGAPSPLANYAFYNSMNSGWVNEPQGAGMRLSGTPAASPTLLIDTGAATTTTNGSSLFANATFSEFLAGQFTLAQAASISSVSGSMLVNTGGNLTVKIYAGNTTPPPFAGDIIPGTAIFSQTFPVPASPIGSNGGFISFPFSSPLPVLPAGTYWASFEPAASFSATMLSGAPNPLPNYAYFVNDNTTWVNDAFAGTPLFDLGIQVYGNNLAGASNGTAGRTIETGTAFGIPDTPQDIITGGDNQVDSFPYNFLIPSGWAEARGTLVQNGLLASAYSAQSGPCLGSGSCTEGTGAGRGVSWRTFASSSSGSMPFVVNAVLDGEFNGGGGTASVGVYVVDQAAFATAVANSGLPTAQFLLNGSTLAALSEGGSSLAALFPPSAVLLNHFQPVTGPGNQLLTVPLSLTSSSNVKPMESVVLIFDVTAYAAPGETANFASTLAPSPTLPLFADSTGQNPLTGLIALGPSVPVTNPPASIVLTAPSPSTNPLGTTVSVTATVTDASANPIPGALVFFAFNSGPNVSPTGPIATGVNGQAVFTYAGNGGTGTDVIQATVGSLTAMPVSLTWTAPGVLDHISISPLTATIAPGGNQAYTAQGFDRLNNSLGDVTAATTFSITPDGSCTGATCTASAIGPHTVMGNDNGKTATASLSVGTTQTPTITFSTPPTPTYLGGNFTVSAMTNSNGALTYSYVSGPCAFVSGATFSSTGGGTRARFKPVRRQRRPSLPVQPRRTLPSARPRRRSRSAPRRRRHTKAGTSR